MDINKVLREYDQLEETHDFGRIESFLLDNIAIADEEGDKSSLITLYNEIIGFYRETSRYKESITSCAQLLKLLEDGNIKDSVEYATSLLNIANACRAAGLLKESMTYFNEVMRIYDSRLEPNDFRYAPLYNNLALLFQEMEDYESAAETLRKALELAKTMPGEDIKVAISHTNLAMSLLKTGELSEAEYNLSEAFRIFDSKPEPDYHYGAALSAMAEAKYMAGEYEDAASFYARALQEVKKNTGYSSAYDITLSNLHQAAAKAREKKAEEKALFDDALKDTNTVRMSGISLAEAFFEECVRPMIEEKFPDYKDRIAAGLCGEGSECMGFDDELSSDHDFGPGCCLWLDDATFDEIGQRLTEEYNALPVLFKGYVRLNMKKGPQRVGVFRISDWYRNIIGLPGAPVSEDEWLFVSDTALGRAVNGKVFTDPKGEFSQIRNRIKDYYPRHVYLRKLCDELARFSQYGQYNYSRMLQRNDRVAAAVCIGEFLQHAMRLCFIFDRKYPPYYKWLSRAVKDRDRRVYEAVKKISEDIFDEKTVSETIASLAGYYLEKLERMGLAYSKDDYLEHHTVKIMNLVNGQGLDHDELVDEIVRIEWDCFDKVHNEGGRAYCQDDWTTFSIMRKSQYLTWDDQMLHSLLNDFNAAVKRGWNMITEKYGRMEESTAPEEWERIKDSFPPIDDEQKKIIESIVAIQVGMMEEFAAKYPYSASNARTIHTFEDTAEDTSYETYLRGEISTYSPQTLVLYGRFVATLASQGRNLAHMIIENTALMYGYRSLDRMEESLSK